MRQRDDFDQTHPSYDVTDEKLATQIDQLVKRLEPYAELDLIREVFVTGVKLTQEECGRGDLKILRTAIKELRYAFKVFAAFQDVPKVTIFGSARSHSSDPEYQAALDFGKRISEAGYMVITGAGDGIMGAGHVGAGREQSFGLNILLPFEQAANETIAGDEKLINFRYFFTRKLFFMKESDAFVLLPGGFGTHDECFEVLTLLQTGRSEPAPVVMLDAPGGNYWKDWYKFMREHLIDKNYVSSEDDSLFLITGDVEEACEEICRFYRRYHSSRYVDRKKKLVLRLKEPLSSKGIDLLNLEFADILSGGSIEDCEPFPEESDEPELSVLPRLCLPFNRKSFARLRQLIDKINTLQ